MNRLKKAWLALTGRLEPEVREVEVPGEAARADLYRVCVPDKDGDAIASYDGKIIYRHLRSLYYATCEQAHSAHPGASVDRVTSFCLGGKHFVGNVSPVEVQPKPKREKGKRAK